MRAIGGSIGCGFRAGFGALAGLSLALAADFAAASLITGLLVDEAQARETVAVALPYPAGTIVIRQSERALYLTRGDGSALRYPIAVGKSGMSWQGEATIQGKFVRPAWSAPDVVRQDHPHFTHVDSRGIAE